MSGCLTQETPPLAAGQESGGYRWRIWRGEESGRLLTEVTAPDGSRTLWGLTRETRLAGAVVDVLSNIQAHRETGVWS